MRLFSEARMRFRWLVYQAVVRNLWPIRLVPKTLAVEAILVPMAMVVTDDLIEKWGQVDDPRLAVQIARLREIRDSGELNPELLEEMRERAMVCAYLADELGLAQA